MSVSIDADEPETAVKELKSELPTPEEQVELTERQAAVRAAINELKSEHKEVLIYADMQQLSNEEVAKILKCPLGTVKSRLNRARTALRKKLSENRELFL